MRDNIGGLNFKRGITSVDEMIEQIEKYIKSQNTKDLHLFINMVMVRFDEFKYEVFDYEEGKFYELTFLKNNNEIAFIELYEDYKITCYLGNDILFEIKIINTNDDI